MKLRPALLAFAVLLLTGSLASSSPASADAPAALAEGDAAFMTPVDEEPDCATDELAFLNNPAPSERAPGPCGACSSQNCRGGQVGQRCMTSGGSIYTCQIPYFQFCSTGGPKCYCWTGPLP